MLNVANASMLERSGEILLKLLLDDQSGNKFITRLLDLNLINKEDVLVINFDQNYKPLINKLLSYIYKRHHNELCPVAAFIHEITKPDLFPPLKLGEPALKSVRQHMIEWSGDIPASPERYLSDQWPSKKSSIPTADGTIFSFMENENRRKPSGYCILL